MPTYQYRCEGCGAQHEEVRSIKAEPLKECPMCHELKLVQLLTGGSGTIFVGADWPSKQNKIESSDVYRTQKDEYNKQYK